MSPYDERPTPILDVDPDKVVITWKMNDNDNQYTLWTATDSGKDGTFEISASITQRD